MQWNYQNKIIQEINDLPEGAFGFIYQTTHTPTGKKYIGKKLFTKAGYRQIKGKKKKIRKASDWLNYWGSNEELQKEVIKNGEDQYTKEILYLCKTRSACNYWETWEIFNHFIYHDYFIMLIRAINII
mgnify:CR=1 FL=1